MIGILDFLIVDEHFNGFILQIKETNSISDTNKKKLET